jgi:hypothetical protein
MDSSRLLMLESEEVPLVERGRRAIRISLNSATSGTILEGSLSERHCLTPD